MSIAFLQWDEWSEAVDNGSKELNPSWEQVEAAILSLDGISRTIVKLTLDEDAYLIVAGGSDENYMVFATKDNGVLSHLTDESKPASRILLDVGGQPGEYAAKRCVSSGTALAAAKTYFENGQLRSDLKWEAT